MWNVRIIAFWYTNKYYPPNLSLDKILLLVNPGSPQKEMAIIHTSESGHSSGYEGEYQEPYAGSPVQVDR